MNGFAIKYEDMSNLMQAYKNTLSVVMENISTCQQDISTIVEDSRFAGQTADSIRAYLDDVHLTLLGSFQVMAQTMLDDIALYKNSYYGIDQATNFILTEETMQKFREKANKKLLDSEDIGDEVKNTISSISDLIFLPHLSWYGIEKNHDNINTTILDLVDNVSAQERITVSTIENTSASLLSSLRACVSKLNSGKLNINGYQAGSFFRDPDVSQMTQLCQDCYESHLDREDLIDQIWDREDELLAEAEERQKEGISKTVGAALMIAGAVACIVLTAGAATPIVVAAAVAGGGTIVFGAADAVEGAQEIYHGSSSDIDSEFRNLLKENVFQGNEEAYRTVEETFAYTSSALIPMGGLSAAGKLTTRSASMAIANGFVSEAAGSASSKAITHITGNETAGFLAGMGASIAVGFGLNVYGENVYKTFNDKVETCIVDVEPNCVSNCTEEYVHSVQKESNLKNVIREKISDKEEMTEEIVSAQIEYGMGMQEIAEEKGDSDSSQIYPVGAN